MLTSILGTHQLCFTLTKYILITGMFRATKNNISKHQYLQCSR